MLSYSGLTNYGKVNLPSVSGWGTNMNILRDPPKSITTRRIDKVGDTIMIDQEIQDAGGRIAESILPFPRGRNVMVGVSYDNYGANGGIGLGQMSLYKGQQAKMPYRVNREGAFRPPILTQKDLLPLSRLPRISMKVDPTPSKVDYSKKVIQQGTAQDYRSVKDTTLDVSMSVNKGEKRETPVEIGVAQYIQDVPQGASSTNVRYFYFGQDATKYTDNSIQTPVKAEAMTNPSAAFEKKTTKGQLAYVNYIQTPVAMAFESNLSGISKTIPHSAQELRLNTLLQGTQWSNIKHRSTKTLESEYQSIPLRDTLRGERMTNKQRPCSQQLKYESISYQPKDVLKGSYQAAVSGVRNEAPMSVNKKLNPTLQMGGFEAKPTQFKLQTGALPTLKEKTLLHKARMLQFSGI
jgi:hypothetical protein